MDNDFDESWNEYTHMLFAVDDNQKILGTFFKKGDFDFNNKTIQGDNIMWIYIQNENEYDFDHDLNPPTNDIKYLFHRDFTDSIKTNEKIYFVKSITYNDKQELNVTYITYEEKQNEITKLSATSRDPKQTTENLKNEIANALKSLEESIKEIETAKSKYKQTKGGAKYFSKNEDGKFNKEEFNKMEILVNKFKTFVDAFITHPVMLKLNSLEKKQFDYLFGITDTKKNNISININYIENVAQVNDSTQIKDIILKILFFHFNITYNHTNKDMIKELNKIVEDINKQNKSILLGESPSNIRIHIKDLANGFINIVSKMKDIINNPAKYYHTINDVFDNIVKSVIEINTIFRKLHELDMSNGKIQINIMDILNSMDTGNEDFIKKLNEYIQENISDKILTYVKINNFKHTIGEQSKWNKRFDILLNSKGIPPFLNNMIVKYNDINEAYNYDRPDAKYYDNSNQLYKYPKQYLFGKFTKIFPPNMSNPDIATQMPQIVAKVKSGNPVFVMGYGASGSGKTSSLIYFKDGEEGKKEGIVIDICKQICNGSFNTIELTTQELFSKNTEQENENDETKQNYDNCHKNDSYINCKSEKYIYKYESGKFIFENFEGNNEVTHHPYRNPNNEDNKQHEFAKTIEYLIDKDRLVKATTNNPQSSRSHSFAFIKFYNKPGANSDTTVPNGYLIVGDFAGVENTFNCESTLTIKDLLNIENSEDKTNPPKLYYGGYDTDKYKETATNIIKNYINFLNNNNNNNKSIKKRQEVISKIFSMSSKNISNDYKNIAESKNKLLSEEEIKKVYDNVYSSGDILTSILEEFKDDIISNAELIIKNKIINNNITNEQIYNIYNYDDKNKVFADDSNVNDNRYVNIAVFKEYKKIYDLNNNFNSEYNTVYDESINNYYKLKNFETVNKILKKYSTTKIEPEFAGLRDSIYAYNVKENIRKKTEYMKDYIDLYKKMQQKKEEAKRIAQAKRIADEKAQAKQIAYQAKQIEDEAKAKRIADAEAEKLKAQEEKRLADEKKRKEDEAIRKAQEEKEEKDKYLEFQKRKIDEKYFLNFVDNIIYPKYAKTFYEMVKLTVKKGPEHNMPFVYNTQDTSYSEDVFKEDFKRWISNILNILKINFIDETLNINMQVFGNYTLDDIFKIINTNNFDSIKSTSIDSNEKNISEKYETFNVIVEDLSIQRNEGRNDDSINNIMSAIGQIKRKLYGETYGSEYYLKTEVINMFNNFKTNKPNINNIENEINTMLKHLIKTKERKVELEDIEKYKFFIDLFSNKSKSFKKTKPFTYNIKKIKTSQDSIVDELRKVFESILKRLEKGKLVCNNRTNEGEFINKSLQDMREDIKNIFYQKQEDILYISPDYVNLCLEKYCPTHSDCFKKETTTQGDNLTIKSDIFKKIFEFLKQNREYSVNDFYNDILISVFCVVNISPGANNPPPVPYIDINELKIALKKFEKEYTDNISIKDYVIPQPIKTELITQLNKTYYKIKGSNVVDDTSEYTDEHTFNELQVSSIMQFKIDNTKNKTVFESIFNDVGDDLTDYLKNKSLISQIHENNKYTNQKIIEYIKKLIESIDNNNAISAIGTLEFLDQISKYHTTQTICFLEPEQGITSEYQDIYDADGNFLLEDNNKK